MADLEKLEQRFAELHEENTALMNSGKCNVDYLRRISAELREVYAKLEELRKLS